MGCMVGGCAAGLRHRAAPAAGVAVPVALASWPRCIEPGPEHARLQRTAGTPDAQQRTPGRQRRGTRAVAIGSAGGQCRRQRLLDQLTRFPPARLAIACDPRRSADRGSLALISELARCAGATRVWLLPAPPGQALDADRLGDWHVALQQLEMTWADSAPLNWLENGHD